MIRLLFNGHDLLFAPYVLIIFLFIIIIIFRTNAPCWMCGCTATPRRRRSACRPWCASRATTCTRAAFARGAKRARRALSGTARARARTTLNACRLCSSTKVTVVQVLARAHGLVQFVHQLQAETARQRLGARPNAQRKRARSSAALGARVLINQLQVHPILRLCERRTEGRQEGKRRRRLGC